MASCKSLFNPLAKSNFNFALVLVVKTIRRRKKDDETYVKESAIHGLPFMLFCFLKYSILLGGIFLRRDFGESFHCGWI